MNLTTALRRLPFVLWATFIAIPPGHGQWDPVADVDFSQISLADFSDHELEVPYFYFHFARVANAVVENGPDRGFLDLAVNRPPEYNKPFNARIMEMQMALAYFYGTNRPWNRYYGDSAVRVRLEAMLQRWTEIQSPDGRYSEYGPDNFSLAPTGFGSMAAAQALEIIVNSGQPFDQDILERARASLRLALIALFTRQDLRNDARQYSNQLSGAFSAALRYLALWPDPELDAVFTAGLAYATANDQSPAGFHYEQGGPDFGYSNVHETNLRVASPLLRARPDLLAQIEAADDRWHQWLAANFVPIDIPGPPVYLTNGGLNTRTSHTTQNATSRPYGDSVISARPFSLTDTEYAASLVSRRAAVETTFGKWGPLSVPNAYSYIPTFVYDAVRDLNTWHPNATERIEATADLPYLASDRFIRLFHDTYPLTVSTVRRPAYYTAFNSGRIRVSRQNYGLGLLWNEAYGPALQSVSGTDWNWGTRRAGSTAIYEESEVPAQLFLNGKGVQPSAGVTALADGMLSARYSLSGFGTKTIEFHERGIRVSVEHPEAFEEVLPLLNLADATIRLNDHQVIFTRPNGSTFVLTVTSPGARIAIAAPGNVVVGLRRRLVIVAASGNLTYELRVSADSSALVGTGDLVNISTRGGTGGGGDVLTGGFVIEESTRRVLIRGLGPALQEFGVAGYLTDPTLTLFKSDTELPISENDNWQDHGMETQIADAAKSAGAFPLVDGSLDAALLQMLEPGAYTVKVRSRTTATGVAMVEVYQVD